MGACILADKAELPADGSIDARKGGMVTKVACWVDVWESRRELAGVVVWYMGACIPSDRAEPTSARMDHREGVSEGFKECCGACWEL